MKRMKTNWLLRRTLVLGVALVSGLTGARAQNSLMPWHTTDGGGGASTGGAFALTGTIGQPDASAPSSGGVFSLTGGFWALPAAVQTPGAPHLSVALTNGLIMISWPRLADGFVLDQKTALNTGPIRTLWMQVEFPYQTNATHIFVTTPPSDMRFYRLRKP